MKQKLKCYPCFIGQDVECAFSLLNANGSGVNIYKFTTYYAKYIVIIYIRYNLNRGRGNERKREGERYRDREKIKQYAYIRSRTTMRFLKRKKNNTYIHHPVLGELKTLFLYKYIYIYGCACVSDHWFKIPIFRICYTICVYLSS